MTPEEIHEKLIELLQEAEPLGDFEYLLHQVVLTERQRIDQAVLDVRADYPEDVFLDGAGTLARMIIDRIRSLIRATTDEGVV